MSLSEDTKYRLGLIVEANRDVPDDEFDLDFWKCGSVGCAIGNAVSRSEKVRRLGLELLEDEDSVFDEDYFPAYLCYEGFDAVVHFLNVPRLHAEYLFHHQRYPYPHDVQKDEVLDRIQQYIDSDGAIDG